SKDSIVSTRPQPLWKDVINQRIRWASKTSKQKNFASLLLGFLVLLTNISILALPIFMVFDPKYLLVYVSLLLFKIITDYVLLRQTALFFNEKVVFWKFLWQPFLYAVMVLIVVFGSIQGNYTWKGRSFKNPS